MATSSSLHAKGGFPLAQEPPDPWEALDIPPTWDRNKIRDAYLVQVRIHHPDQYRQDPSRYRIQEERMKTINQAYRWALDHPPAPPGAKSPGPRETAVTVCPDHHKTATRACRRCRRPLCLLCAGYRQLLCSKHFARAQQRRVRGRVLKEWGPLIALIVLLRSLGVPGLYTAGGILTYIAWLGFRFLLSRRWFGCLAVLMLPYSLVVAGIWSLLQSLKDWNRPVARSAQDRR